MRRLHDALSAKDRTCWVDWEGIPPSAKWMETLESAIESSEAFLFVLSPDSIASKVCIEELDHATAHNKRIVPIVAVPVDASAVPQAATERNWLFFDDSHDFDASLEQLIATLDTDPEWTALHTRLVVRSVEWDSSGRDPSFALRGKDLETAEAWLTSNDARKDPQPTPLHTEYIVTSRAVETRSQRRRTIGLAIGLVVALVLAAVAFLQFRRAEDEAQVATSRELASSSLLRGATDPDLGLALAVEAGKVESTDEADQAIRQNLEDVYVEQVLEADGTSMTAMDVSPDGSTLIAAGGGQASAFDLETGEVTATFDVPAREIDGLAINPDGSRIAVAGGEAAVIMDPATEEVTEQLDGGPGKDWWVAWHPDGKELVTAGNDGVVRTWDADGQELSRHAMHGGEAVFSVDYSADGTMLVSGGRDGFVRVWDPASGKESQAFEVAGTQVAEGEATDVNAVAFAPDGRSVAGGADDGSAFVWNLKTGREMLLPGGEQPVDGIDYRDDSTRVAVSNLDGSVLVFDVSKGGDEGVLVATLLGHSGAIWEVSYLDDGERLASASGDGTARIWRPEPSDASSTFEGGRGSVLGATFAPDGDSIATTNLDGTLMLWEAGGDQPAATLEAEGRGALDLWSPSFDPDGERIVAGVGNGTVQIWDVETGEVLAAFDGHDLRVVGAEFSPNGSQVVSGSQERRDAARVWDSETGEEIASFGGHEDWVFDVSWSPDGGRIVSAGAEGTARVWDPATGEESLVLEGHRDFVRTASFSPDGQKIITGGEDRTARIWDAETGQELQILRGHTDSVLSATFSPDGETVATAGPDRTVRIWNADDGELFDVLKGHDDWIGQVAFSPDGSELVTASYDDTASIMTCALCLNFDDLLELGESRVTHVLTPEEREQYLHE